MGAEYISVLQTERGWVREHYRAVLYNYREATKSSFKAQWLNRLRHLRDVHKELGRKIHAA